MLLNEIKQIKQINQLSEAISITHLTPIVKQAILTSISSDLSQISHLKANLTQFKDQVDEGYGKSAREALSNTFYRELLPTLANNIDNAINAQLPDTLQAVTFKRIGSSGQARGQIIIIQTDIVEKIGNAVIAQLFDVVYDSGSDYFDELFSKSTISSTMEQIKRNRDSRNISTKL
jgi:phage gp46-like protein